MSVPPAATLVRTTSRVPRTNSTPLQRLRRRFSDVTDPAGRDAGFTLIEVLVSFVLFVVVAAAATTAIVSSQNAAHIGQQRVDASNVAQSFIASVQQNTQTSTNGTTTLTASVKGEDFSVTRTIAFFYGATACNPGGSYKVSVEVRQKQTNTFLARSDTVITC